MRRLWPALLLVLTLVPVAAAAADEGPRRGVPPHQEMHQDDGNSPTDLARSAGSAELLITSAGRTRDFGGRGFEGKSGTTHESDSGSISLAGGIVAPQTHPAPSKAESLPYHATAPPVIV